MPHDPERHGPRRVVGPGFHARVFAAVRCVPPGRVTTYGDIAAALGRRSVARRVGEALATCPDSVPWHRVVNARGMVSARADGKPSTRQIRLLRAEGIAVDRSGRIARFAALRYENRDSSLLGRDRNASCLWAARAANARGRLSVARPPDALRWTPPAARA